MKNGFYLSTYLYINPLAHLTKIRLRHDQNVSLWKKEGDRIELIHYWELERITGIKQHDRAFFDIEQAKMVIGQLLRQYDLSLDDMQEVWGTPELATCDEYHSLNDYPEISYHSLCHLCSSLLLDSRIFYEEDVLSLAVDGAPDNVIDLNIEDKAYYAGSYSKKGEIVDIFPISSPGPLWGIARDHYYLREGTLMALANATTSKMFATPLQEIHVRDVNTVKDVVVDMMNLFEYVDKLTIDDAGVLFNHYDERFTERENKISMVMKEVQTKSIQVMEKNIDRILDKYQIDPKDTYLSLSGGYSLNCPSNSYLMQKYKFKGFVAPPCINDAGMSLGVALYAFHKKINGERLHFKFANSYYGDMDQSFDAWMETYQHFIACVSDLQVDTLMEDIIDHPVAWFNGSAEVGPRALGNRSLIADPRSDKARDILNTVKQREWWRPIAPIILEEELGNWFENSYPSPYMLHTFMVKEDKLAAVPAIVHLDNSARVQTITEQDNPLLYRLLIAFKEKHGVPIICNTSLNDKGEPIINSLDELINFVLRKGIKIAYVNGKRVEIKNHDDFRETQVAKRKLQFDQYMSEEEKNEWLEKLNPYNVPEDNLRVYIENPRLYKQIDLKNKKDVRMLESITQIRKNRFQIL